MEKQKWYKLVTRNEIKELKTKLVEKGFKTEKEAGTFIGWYQAAGFLLPSNALSIVLALLNIDIGTLYYLIIALFSLNFASRYVINNYEEDLEGLKKKLKILKPLTILIFAIWLFYVIMALLILNAIL